MIGYLILCLCAIASVILIIAYICYRMTFRAAKRQPLGPDEYRTPKGAVYDPHREFMIGLMKQLRAMDCETFTITSHDGLKLVAQYYEYAPGAPMELMFHGYRSTSESDLCGGVQRCFSLGRSAVLVHQRGCGESEGHVISFGVNEHRDCLAWVDFLVRHFGEEVKIYLTGISMGAATVLMAAGKPLPKQVVGVIADCGYTSPKAIIQKVAKDRGFPPKLVYPLIRLGAKVYGNFDPEEYSPIEAVKTIHVPVVFIHGETDSFVPCSMSEENYKACASEQKHLFTVANTGHGLAYLIDPEGYKQALKTFEE